MTDLCGKWLLQNDFINTFCEMNRNVVVPADMVVSIILTAMLTDADGC